LRRKILISLLFATLIIITSSPSNKFHVLANSFIKVPDDYPTLQQAVNRANPGDTILVAPGAYYESIVVDKPISLMGGGRESTFIMGSKVGKLGENEIIIKIISPGVKISGFRIGDQNVLHLSGIALYNSTNCVISDNTIINNQFGIWLHTSSNCTIEKNISILNEVGIFLYFSANNTIRNNIANSNERQGIHLMHNSSNNKIISNLCKSNDENGILLQGFCNNVDLINNTCISNKLSGIHIEDSGYNRVCYNTLAMNVFGISIQGKGSIGNKVTQNNIEGNVKLGVFGHGEVEVLAALNWWGDPTGPYHPTENPHGSGNPAYTKVDFKAWSRTPIKGAPILPIIVVSDLSVYPYRVRPKESLLILMDVKNTRGWEEDCRIELLMDGEVVAAKKVTLSSKEARTISFEVMGGEEGVHVINVGDLFASFEVKELARPLKPKRITVPVDYPTIQGAINAADPYDVILVQPGTYFEYIVIDKPISLIGENKESVIIRGLGTRDIIYVSSDDVKIANFTLAGAKHYGAGIRIERSRKCVISSNILTNNGYGVFLHRSSDNLIENNVACSNIHAGIFLWSCSSHNIIRNNTCFSNGKFIEEEGRLSPFSSGIYAWKLCSFNLIIDNNCNSHPDFGIKVHVLSNNNTIACNKLFNNTLGIGVFFSENNVVANNLLSSNLEIGIIVHPISVNNLIFNNTIDSSHVGVSIGFSSNHNTVDKNVCLNNEYGIFLSSSSKNIVANNICNSNKGSGISLVNSTYNEVFHNMLLMNRIGVTVEGIISSGNVISWSDIRENALFGVVLKSGSSIIENNIIFGNKQFGIFLWPSSDNNTITNNTCSLNGEGGILLRSSSYNRLTYNTILSNNAININGFGIWLDNSSYNKITYNTISKNGDGVRISYSSTMNTLNWNNIVGNTLGIHNEGRNWMDATFNWWGDETGPHHPTLNPTGKGDRVSDNVLFKPWLTTPIGRAIGPTLKLSNLSISLSEAEVGEPITVSVEVRNVGETEGTYRIALKLNGTVEATKDVTLSGGGSSVVTFRVNKDVAGTYSVEVDGLTGFFRLKVKAVPPAAPPWHLYVAAAIIIMAAAAAAVTLARRRRAAPCPAPPSS
jgi:parallel beta-helix repeat protein